MAYVAPAPTAVNFELSSGYTAPAGNDINLDLGEEKVRNRVVLEQPYSLRLAKSMVQPYALPFVVLKSIDQVYGLRLGAVVTQPYGDAAVVSRSLLQYYGDAVLARAALIQLYAEALQIRTTLEQPYSYPARLQSILEQRYAISANQVQGISEQLYAIQSIELARSTLVQPFAILDGTGRHTAYAVSVVSGGTDLQFNHVNIEAGHDQFALSCEVHLATQVDYVQSLVMDDLTITINGEVFEFFVESKQRNRGHATAEYSIKGLSKTALLDAPYAEPVTDDLSGLASQIVADLAADYTLNWQTVDWYIPADTLLPADQTPLAVIRQIAAAVGAVLQTEPDGTLTIEPSYPVSVPLWDSAAVQYTFSDAFDFFSTGENFEHRDGYNRFLISDQLTSEDSTRLEEEPLTSSKKYIRAYHTPWRDDFELAHTGGDWVSIEPLGIEEQLIEDEVVEFVAGTGNTSYPMYERVAVEWLRENLGTVTFGEDGTLEAAVEGESLLKLSYRTKCLKYLVVDPLTEPLQLVAGEVD